MVGKRKNELQECLPILKKYMRTEYYQELKITQAPEFFLDIVSCSDKHEVAL